MIEINKTNNTIFTVKGVLTGNQLVSETGEKYKVAFYNKDYQALTESIKRCNDQINDHINDVSSWKSEGFFLLRPSSTSFFIVVNFIIEAVKVYI